MNNKPFQCDICEKTFEQKSVLVVHLKIHSDEKNFIYNICKNICKK